MNKHKKIQIKNKIKINNKIKKLKKNDLIFKLSYIKINKIKVKHMKDLTTIIKLISNH